MAPTQTTNRSTLILNQALVRGPVRLALFALTLLAGCGESRDLDLNFPSEETFVRSETVRVYGVRLEADQAGRCPELLRQARLGPLGDARVDTGQQSVCDFRAGSVSVPDAGGGLAAWIATASSDSGQTLLTGCTVSDVVVDDGPLRIVLSPTDTYRQLYPAESAPPPCTVDDKCLRSCR